MVPARTSSISIDPIECLPLGDNGVVAAKVTNEPLAAQVRIYFRRVNAGQPDNYYVKAHAVGNGIYKALLPRPIAAAVDRQKDSGPAPAGADESPVYEPVEIYAKLVDFKGQDLATSASTTVAVTWTCPSPESAHPVPGEGLNMTLGETRPFQGEDPPFHFECTGIVIREWNGQLFEDPICRDYPVPLEPRIIITPRGSSINKGGESVEFQTVKVFYGTDRERTGKTEPSKFYLGGRGPLEVGTCEVSIPVTHRTGELEGPSGSEKADPEKHIVLLTVTPKPEAAFVSELEGAVRADSEHEVLVFIHGYNVSFEDAARRTAQMAADLEFDGGPVMYSWPSQASFRRYSVDETNIRWTVPHLQQFLDLVVQRTGASKVHLLAHSMGNRAVTEVLLRYAAEAARTPGTPPQFNQIVLVAPDVDAGVFRDEIAPRIQSVGERVTLYASDNDKALIVSKNVHGHQRAGEGIFIAEGVETIDASNVASSLSKMFGLGHSYFADKAIVIHDLKLLLDGASPADRNLADREVEAGNYWEIVP